jgi:hypothetical protein
MSPSHAATFDQIKDMTRQDPLGSMNRASKKVLSHPDETSAFRIQLECKAPDEAQQAADLPCITISRRKSCRHTFTVL